MTILKARGTRLANSTFQVRDTKEGLMDIELLTRTWPKDMLMNNYFIRRIITNKLKHRKTVYKNSRDQVVIEDLKRIEPIKNRCVMSAETVKNFFDPFWEKIVKNDNYQKLKENIQRERNEHSVLPEPKDLFNAINKLGKEPKILILGQDPYPSKGTPDGFAFSTPRSKTPVSLKWIFEEILRDFYNGDKSIAEFNTNNLKEWALQGVILLNTALTVREDEPGSHMEYWSWFTKNMIRFITGYAKKPMVIMLWGKHAQGFKDDIRSDKHLILEAPHPAYEARKGGEGGFIGCSHFTKANEFLSFTRPKAEQSLIDWGTHNNVEQ